VHVPLTEAQTAHTQTRQDEGREVLGHFSDPDPCLAAADSFGELANLGQGPEQKGPGKHGKPAGSADGPAEAVTQWLF
jgi:hypothetical protein